MNRLAHDNCNKAKCKTCIFGNTPVQLSPERIQEIHTYLANFTASHIFHITNKTCYGALEYQARILYAMKLIPEPTVESFLVTAKQTLNI